MVFVDKGMRSILPSDNVAFDYAPQVSSQKIVGPKGGVTRSQQKLSKTCSNHGLWHIIEWSRSSSLEDRKIMQFSLILLPTVCYRY